MLNSAEKKTLLKIAREAIEAKASGKLRLLNPAIESDALKQNSGWWCPLPC